MNKNAIKKFAIEARKKLIDSVTDKAGMLGITEKSCSEPITKGVDFEVYQTVAGTEVTLNKRKCEQRRRLVSQIHSRGFEAVVEEVAYTWFNRICAIRFMEVNDYLPNRVRVLSSEKEGKMEPDLVTLAPDVDLDLTAQDKEEIINWKLSGASEDTDKLYCKLFLKQCHQLHDILPGLFEADSDYMELLFGISYTNKDDVIYMLVNPETGIPEEDFNVSTFDEYGKTTGQVEIIGWLYQYYNTELKDDTFAKLKKNIKITKERIPAATQLFTPDWIVRYMVENSVGRIWIEHLRAVNPSTDEKATAERFGWKYYLPEAEQEDAVNVKLAEIRSTYKDLKPTDITCIDPCMGSGHILIAMFDVLMDIYESAGYDKREAAFEIVEHNIHGLDIDKRAYQLAYFAVMMKGRGYNRRFLRGRDGKPEPKVYAIAESNEINRNHLKFFGTHLSDMERELAVMQIERLLDIFVDAREYGSILNVDGCDWDILERFVEDLGTVGQISFESVGSDETQKSIRKLIKIARNLEKKYDAVVTNPPYMGSKSMSEKLASYVQKHFELAKFDLFSTFIIRGLEMVKKFGCSCLVTMQSWMFLSSYEKMRNELLCNYSLDNLLHMGNMVMGIAFGTCVSSFRKMHLSNYKAKFIYVDYKDIQEDIPSCFPTENKRNGIKRIDQFEKIPGKPVAYWASDRMIENFIEYPPIGEIFELKQGLITADNERFIRNWSEISNCRFVPNASSIKDFDNQKGKWLPYNKGGEYRKWYGNNDLVLNWENQGYEIRNFRNDKGKLLSRPQNIQYFGKEGASWSIITNGNFSLRYTPSGFGFDARGSMMFSKNVSIFYALAIMCSNVARYYLSFLSPTVSFEVGNISKVPFIYNSDRLKVIENFSKECVKLAKKDWDSFETSWDFQRHPLLYKNSTIAEAFEQWQKKCTDRFNHIKVNEEELNRIFIDIYGLQDELTPEVEDKDITVRKADLSRDIRSFISYAIGCMFGRYSLDEEGLIYAGGEWDSNKYKTFIPDEDNCIPITDEEYFPDDIVGRFVEFVKTVYGAATLEENLDFIAKALGNKGNTSREVIRNYFLKDFYADHLKVYQKKPIYWLFDSGRENGFKALIYMHRYDVDTVGRVRMDYLHRAQKYVETAMQSAQYTIENTTSASEKSKATKAVTKYMKQLAEMKIYDEAIAHIANKRIEIDLDDGVKVNYEKFQGVEVAQEGKKALKVDLLAKIK